MTHALLYYIMSNMKSVDVRSLQHRLGSFLDQVEAGEEIEVLRRKKPIARIVPYRADRPVEPWPDLYERVSALYPDGALDEAASAIIYGDRGEA